MTDCACTNFPGALGNVTIGASLGVGTASPQKKLHVQSAGADTQIYVSDTSPSMLLGNAQTPGGSMNTTLAMATVNGHYGLPTAGDARLSTYGTAHGSIYIDSNYAGVGPTTNVVLQPLTGNVGIGVMNPGTRLEVGYNTATVAAHGMQLLNAAPNSRASINLLASDGAQIRGARIYATPDGAGWQDTRLTFGTQSVGTNNYIDTMTLRNANVGIGTTDPKKKLHVQSAGPNTQLYLSDAAPSVDLSNHADPAFSTMRTILAMATGAHYGLNAGDAILATYGSAHGNLHINSNYAGGSTNVVLQPGTGNVGIGTAGPTAKLQVAGPTTPNATALQVSGPPSQQGYTAIISGDVRIDGVLDVTGNIDTSNGKVYGAVYN